MKLLKYFCILFVITISKTPLAIESPLRNIKNISITTKLPDISPTKVIGLCTGGVFLLATGNALPCLKIAVGAVSLLIPTWITTEILTTFKGNPLSYWEILRKANGIQEKISTIVSLQKQLQSIIQEYEKNSKDLETNQNPPLSKEKLAQLQQKQQSYTHQFQKLSQKRNLLVSQISEKEQNALEEAKYSKDTATDVLSAILQLRTTFTCGTQNIMG